MNTHRKLLAWQECRALIRLVYAATSRFPIHERYGLSSQLRRAAVSSAANIAEGFARFGPRETAHGLSTSLGSLAELDTLLAVVEDQGYLEAESLEQISHQLRRTSRLVMALQQKVRSRC